MDLLSAIYTAIAIMFIYQWVSVEGKKSDFILGIAFLCILSYIKNDGFIVYMLGVLIALAIYFVIQRKHLLPKLSLFKKTSTWVYILALILFFIVPFTFLKFHYNL